MKTWVHISSIGEFNAALPFLELYRKKKKKDFFITYFNPDCEQAILDSGISKDLTALPLETPWGYMKIIRTIRPSEVLFFEMELWPLLLCILKYKKTPFRLINAYLYPEVFAKYLRLRFFFALFFSAYEKIFVQSQRDKDHFTQLGAKLENITVVGDLKYDQAIHIQKKYSHSMFHGDLLIVFGSIHLKEIPHILPPIHALLNERKDVKIVIAPRYLESIPTLLNTFKVHQPLLFSQIKANANKISSPILLLDTFGDLRSIYSLADLAIMGGSFYPFGGQNPLEPIAANTPTCIGPYHHHFFQNVKDLSPHIAVVTSNELEQRLLQMKKKSTGDHGAKKLKALSGTSQRILKEW